MYAKILIVRPDHYFSVPGQKYGKISYAINDFMEEGNVVDRRKAFEQWASLRQILGSTGCPAPQIFVFHQPKGFPDAVFAANGGFVCNEKTVILSRFRKKERQGEERFFKRIFRKCGLKIVTLSSDAYFEGAGDARYFYDPGSGEKLLALGYGPRSNAQGVCEVSEIATRDASGFYFFALLEPWYHLDLCFCPIGKKVLLYYPAAFMPSGQEALRRFPHSYPVSESDARNHVCNGIPLPADENGDQWYFIVDQKISAELEQHLRTLGITIVKIDLGEFNNSGGDAFCLVNFIG